MRIAGPQFRRDAGSMLQLLWAGHELRTFESNIRLRVHLGRNSSGGRRRGAAQAARRLEHERRLRVAADAELRDRIRHIKAETAAGLSAVRMVRGTRWCQTEEVDDPDLRAPPTRAFQIHVVQSAWRLVIL